MITPRQIFDATNGGLDIIKYYYPEADEKKFFRMRDERTPSSKMKKFGDVWKCTDFGDDSHARNAIDICMREENLSFSQAVYTLAGRYGITDNSIYEANRPEIRQRDAEGDEKPDDFNYETREFTERELKILGPRVTSETCRKYGYRSLASYSVTTADKETGKIKTTVVRSTDTYPIFMRECSCTDSRNTRQTFYKVYQPLAFDKAHRFFYRGNRPSSYINGYDELKAACDKYEKQKAENDEFFDTGKKEKRKSREKYPEAVICSGERDALCCAALGYLPLWFNSESSDLPEDEYRKISNMVEIIYNIPDIDETGMRKGVELAMKFLEIRTVWLPDWLKTYRDARGKHRKDLRDYVELCPDTRSFKNLLETAMPMRFWEQARVKDDVRMEINSEYLIHHLRHNGFGTIENKNDKTGQSFIHIDKNVVREIYPKDIKKYLRGFMEERNMSIKLRNLVNNSSRIKSDLFELLGEMKLDFTDFDHSRQYLFFENVAWEVMPDRVAEHRGRIDKYVWQEEIIPYRVKRLEPSFTITRNADADADTFDAGTYGIEVKSARSKFFSYLINTSRVYWREEMEQRLEAYEGDREQYRAENRFSIDGRLLAEDERDEQKQHLINKIFAIGYLMHRYKMVSRSWCVYAMDWKMSENPGDSNGRSGKSFCFKTLRRFMKSVTLPGRNPKLIDNPHIYDRVTEHTDYVLIDDAGKNLDFNFNFFFDTITGDWIVNPKNNKSYEIPFDLAPKMAITTNFTPTATDPSTQARLLYTVFSDWYHEKTDENDYLETRSIRDDFGMELHDNLYPADDWNADINFFVDCLQFYLTTIGRSIKINPPMKNVQQRTLMAVMGQPFHDWALVYFSPEGGNI
ncbi:MAG: hypothetical protein LBL04_02060, partial [Bacteroidales bacterium]|nr:hypothetical protein [Bacteroidales bacterium]